VGQECSKSSKRSTSEGRLLRRRNPRCSAKMESKPWPQTKRSAAYPMHSIRTHRLKYPYIGQQSRDRSSYKRDSAMCNMFWSIFGLKSSEDYAP
jgi:hypothetical protein